jgi:hypothetical protein
MPNTVHEKAPFLSSRFARPLVFATLGALAGCAPDAPTGVQPDAPALARARPGAAWTPAIRVEDIPGTHEAFNTPALEGCPFIAPDGRTLYFASNRPGGLGGTDIWIATREGPDAPWGAPVNAGAPVNSPSNEVCPTLARNGHTLFFVSSRPGGCGGDDIYVTRRRDDRGYDAPENLGCHLNSAGNEASPSYLTEPGSGPVLYFSSTRAGGFAPDPVGAVTGDADIYRSEWHGGAFGPAMLVPGVNSAAADLQPNVERDGRELYFASNRPGTLGGLDLFVATRAKAQHAWGTPQNLGPNVNSALGDDQRPSLSWDASTLYFGSSRPGGEGSLDLYMTTR